MTAFDLDPQGYLPLLRQLFARFAPRPKTRRSNVACCA